MARAQHDYDDIPGTFVFDAERSRQGYGINMFCMSLVEPEHRDAFRLDEDAYLGQFRLTAEQRAQAREDGTLAAIRPQLEAAERGR